jgi:hypothetical protein
MLKKTNTGLVIAMVLGLGLLAGSAEATFLTPSNVTVSSEFTPDGRLGVDAINGSGLTGSGTNATHDAAVGNMWLSNGGVSAEWIRFDLGQAYDLSKIFIWNYNENHAVNAANARGVNDFTVDVSTDDANWSAPTTGGSQTALAIVGGYAASIPLTCDLPIDASAVRYVRFTIDSNYGAATYVGLSEVRFEGDEPYTGPVLFSNLAAPDITTTSAVVQASADTNLTDIVLVWDTSDMGVAITNWAVSHSLGGASNGAVVTGMMTNLLADSDYSWRLYGTNVTTGVSGWSPASSVQTSLTAAQAPVFTDADASWAGVDLTWQDNAANETGYLLQRSDSGTGGPFTVIATLPADTVSYADVGLAESSNYVYQLAATNAANGSSTEFAAAQISATTGIKPLAQLGILDLTANGGINPATGAVWKEGDAYRFAFSSSTGTDATSKDIDYYNTFVQDLADASGLGIGAGVGVTWKAIASTADVAARDNTETATGPGESIWLLNGTSLVADDYADLYGSDSHSTAINRSETFGAPFDGGDFTSVWTGSDGAGGIKANDQLGDDDGTSHTGLFNFTSGAHWIDRFSLDNAGIKGVYGLSQLLTVRGLITIVNDAPSHVLAESATFNAIVQVPTTNANVYVYWGTTDGSTNAAAWSTNAFVGSLTNAGYEAVSYAVTGLAPETEYFYTFFASNDVVRAWAEPSTNFTTFPSVFVTAENLPASDTTTNAAVFNARLWSLGTNADVYVYWGTEDATNIAAAWATNAFVGSWTDVIASNISYAATGLAPDTQYYYSFLATNDSTAVWPQPSTTFLTHLGAAQTPVFLSAVGSFAGVSLTWQDNANHETGYLLQRLNTGTGGTYSVIATLAADTVSYSDIGLGSQSNFVYRLAATNAITGSSTDFAAAQISAKTVLRPLTVLGILDLDANGKINPATGAVWKNGDTYRFAFVSIATVDALSTNIADYNAFIQGVADSSAAFPNLGEVTWKAIGSTTTVDARDNTATNPNTNGFGEAIFLLNGSTVIAIGYADLWDGNIAAQLRITEENTIRATGTELWGNWTGVWTGTGDNGTGSSPLGTNANVRLGLARAETHFWESRSTGLGTANLPMYGLSQTLTLYQEAPPAGVFLILR